MRWLHPEAARMAAALAGRLARETGMGSVWLLRETGEVLARAGEVLPPPQEAALAALAAGLFQAGKRLSVLLGRTEPSTRVLCGGTQELHFLPVGEDAVLVVKPGTDLPPSLVRARALETVRELRAALAPPAAPEAHLWEEAPFLAEGQARLQAVLGYKCAAGAPLAAEPLPRAR